MFLIGALIAPTAIPLLSIRTYMAYTMRLGIQQQKFENQPESRLPQIFSDMVGWEDRVKIVADYVHSLPREEQKVTAIGASNYGDAGAVDLFGPKYGLPKAISTANNYWIWGPREFTGESVILMDEDSPEKYVDHCKSLSVVARPNNPYARPDENRPIYHCVPRVFSRPTGDSMKTQFEQMMDGLGDVEAFLAGEQEGFKAYVPQEVDVKAIRNRLGMTQAKFSNIWLQPRRNQALGGRTQNPRSAGSDFADCDR